ncbi:NADH-quinone oxidoreductase subunit C [Streptomyces sp. NPDC008137]|uniref:NADH-quinone oxidoreductase subunit C n=1 Tax=Streptomyces sp. NPDC008137 TaxID=3364813 RepID=UPI0036EA92FA
MNAVGWLPADVQELFGTDATAEESYEVLTVDVPPATWISALETARDRLGCTYFDWLSAVDEPGTGFRVTAHVAALSPLRRLLLRTTIPHETPALPSAVGVYAGAAWHERETHEMFGIAFEGHPALDHLLLPDSFEGHPLRKDFVLAARVVKAWPGAKEPGESEHGGPKRRQMLPPGVPDPNEWGPLKGQLPPAPSRPTRATGRERPARGATGPAGERPVRRSRSAAEGSASQAPAGSTGAESSPTSEPVPAEGGSSTPSTPPPASPRRARSAGEGSASQRTQPGSTAGPRRARSASEGSTSQRAAPAPGDSASRPESDSAPRTPRSSDAPWHHARPAFEDQEPAPSSERSETSESRPETRPESVGTDSDDTGEPREPSDTPKPPDNPEDPTPPTGGTR